GNLTAMAGSAVTQTGPLTIPGTSSFNAGSHVITLTNTSNLFTGAMTFTNSGSNDVAVINNTATVLATSAIGNNFTLTANGAITQTGALTVPGTSSFTAGANAITLSQSNTFTGAVSLSNSGANNVQVTNSTALVLGASTIGSGTLGLTVGGSISETGALVQAANAGNITLNITAPSSDILLNTQPNDTNGSILFTGTLSNVRDVARRNINANAGSTVTNITLLTNLRNVTIIFDNAGVAAPALTLHSGGSLYVD